MSDVSEKPGFDPRDLRRAFGCFMTGVTIVTTQDENGQPNGFTANSFTSVSIDPPLLLVNIATAAYGFPVFSRAGGFAVNILAGNQRDLSVRFARAGEDKFAGLSWQGGPTGSPLLDDVVAWFDCEMYQQVEAGDHVVLIGRVLDYHYNTHAPLGFCRGAYVGSALSPQMLQLISSPGELRVGAIIEYNGRVLLERVPANGSLRLPLSGSVGTTSIGDSLLGKLAAVGIDVELPFIYSAFEEHGVRYVYYLGQLPSREDAPVLNGMEFYDFDLVTWEEINDPAVITMLQRFIREKKYGNFNLYIGDPRLGETHPLDAAAKA